MKHYTRILALLLALMLTLSACSQGGSSAGESSGTSSAASGETAEEGETGGPILDLPLTTEDVTFTMFISGLDNLTSRFMRTQALSWNSSPAALRKRTISSACF